MPNFIRDVEEIRQRAIRNLEDGAVTESYELDPDRSVAILNEALATEIVCVLRYMHHYFMATGVHAKAVSAEFKEHADAEREHADEIAERIQQLGGKPDFNPRTLLERSVAQYVEGETLGDMIREDLIAERVVIDVYNQMIRYFGEKDPTTRVLLEHILAEEEEHASDLSDLLYIVEPSTGETEGEDPGVHPLQMHGGSRGQGQGGANQQRNQTGEGQQRGTQAAQATKASDEDEESADDVDRFVGRIDRADDEPRPMAQTLADREGGARGSQRGTPQQGGNERGQQQRGGQQQAQRNQGQNQGRSQGTANRQSTEQFAGRGSVNAGRTSAPTGAAGANASRVETRNPEGEIRPSRATGSGRPDSRTAPPEHEPGTTGRRRRNDEPSTSIDTGDDGGMGGGTRAVRVTNKQRKNRAA